MKVSTSSQSKSHVLESFGLKSGIQRNLNPYVRNRDLSWAGENTHNKDRISTQYINSKSTGMGEKKLSKRFFKNRAKQMIKAIRKESKDRQNEFGSRSSIISDIDRSSTIHH